jgi:hypothetical protein
MAIQLKPQITQNPTKKEPLFWNIWKLKVRGDEVKYKAWVGNYLVCGITRGDREAVKDVLNRMAAAENDLIDKVKQLVDQVVENVVMASKSGSYDIGLFMSTIFHVAEFMGIIVDIKRPFNPRLSSKWWGKIKVVFKGADGHMAFSKHGVVRYVEFYGDVVPRDKLYNVIYEAARIAFNAYFWAFRSTSQ